MLVDVEHQVITSKLLEDMSPNVLLQRLRLAYWVADHRVTHGKYVLRAIYKTEPVGGQSRAEGTGGSTPPFLKLFLDQVSSLQAPKLIQIYTNTDCYCFVVFCTWVLSNRDGRISAGL